MVAILVVCLSLPPFSCRPVEFYLTESMPVMQWMEAQAKAVEWLEKHPGMRKESLKVLRGRAA
jgi:hypothetical protein